MACALAPPHFTSIGQAPGVVCVPTVQDQLTKPLPSAIFVVSPCAVLGPDAYVTVLEHDTPGAMRIVTRPIEPRVTGERTSTNAS